MPRRRFRTQTFGRKSTAEQLARLFQIFRCVDPQRRAVNDHDIDAHAGIERPQLFESFALLVGRWRQPDKAFERRTAVRIKPDVMVVRSIAGRVRAREFFRLQMAGPDLRACNLDDIRVGSFGRIGDDSG